ncbi:paralemmin-1-like [Electrophorus electricus]|uniref:paralemmin-1-like n=1 Tax=Electrophorus electricus TaxID=8005 RepID=UPI000F0A43B8|nr:paralemmin-1-like [Electrophorus electricus]
MDEAEMYQQRLQIIAEKRQVQAEDERVRRETEEEWLKVVQHQRKSIRDKWLMEPTLSSMEAHGPGSMPGSSPQRTEESTEEAKIITQIEEDMDITENMNYEQSSQIVEKPLPLSDKVEKHIEANPGEEANNGSATSENALNPRILLENGQLKRSVLGILEVQGERELKTGATTMIMASLSAVAPEAPGEIVFDDDHQTVHTMRGIKDRLPSGKELNQILEVVSEEED